MNNYYDLNLLNERYNLIKYTFSKEKIKHLESKDFKMGKLNGIFTFRYFKRKDLLLNGAIMYCYTYKIIDSDIDRYYFLDTWLIYSPLIKYRTTPQELSKIYDKLDTFVTTNKQLKYKKLINIITNPLSEPRFIALPKEIAGEEEIYLCYSQVNKSLNKDLDTGVNLILVNKSISKEIIYLSDEVLTLLKENANGN
ncbi:MAG: hypothetical protein RR342_02115 [Bacilli bacterium]